MSKAKKDRSDDPGRTKPRLAMPGQASATDRIPGSLPLRNALVRILFGLYLLCYFLSCAPKVNLMFSSRGITIPYLMPDWALPPVLCTGLYLLTLGVICAFIAGYRTQYITPLLLGLFLYFYFLNLSVNNTAYDRLSIIFMCILCFARLDAVWRFFGRRSDAEPISPMVSAWPIRMITLQVSLLYFGAGLWKAISPAWRTGDMLYYTFMGPWGSPLALWLVQLELPRVCWTLMIWSVVAWELFMPVGLNVRRFCKASIVIGIAFHVGNWVFINVPEFLNCIAAYVLFLEPQEVRDWGNRSLARFGDAIRRVAQ
jgi:hypothetical protein